MSIDDFEQKAPNKPNFGLVVGLACGALLILFVLALFFVRFDGRHLSFRHHDPHPTSQLMEPAPASQPLVAVA